MGYKWKPSKAQRKAFAIRMRDGEEAKSYKERKEIRAKKRRESSKFDYSSAGGFYIPTRGQYDFSISLNGDLTSTQEFAQQQIIFGYVNNEKIHHDYIHTINEIIRTSIK